MKRLSLLFAAVLLAACTNGNGPLPRAKASASLDEAFASYLQAVADSAEDLHSVMVLQHGKVLEEKFFVPDTAHILNSVSKTFTSTAVGFAISEGLLHLDDKIVDLFPESVPENASDTLKADGPWTQLPHAGQGVFHFIHRRTAADAAGSRGPQQNDRGAVCIG